MKLIIKLCVFFICISGFAQTEKYTISGQIKDASDGEDMPFVNIEIKDLSGVGTVSNTYGFYSITLPKGQYSVAYQFVGYRVIEKTIDLIKDIGVNIELETEAQALEEVVITAEREDINITRNQMSITQINAKDIKELPAFGGEPDIIKIMQFNPVVKAAGEGNSGFYVRGGGLDQNLILLDEAPVYNPSHLLGFFPSLMVMP